MPRFFDAMHAVNWQHPLFVVSAFLVGSCVGSFLNVAIYRLPRGLSVNQPKRSFCPQCEKEIPWYRNIPLLTWLLQGGKCAECACRIPFRYFLVELLTACLFLLMWVAFPASPALALFYMALMALLVVVVFVDAELMVIPLSVTWLGTGLGLLAGVLIQEHLRATSWSEGLWMSVLGFLAGFGGLYAVVILGKLAFGKKNMRFDEPVEWMLREPDEEVEGDDTYQELCFVIDGEAHGWSYLFFRDSDRLIIEGSGFRVDGKKIKAKELVIKGDRIEVKGKTLMIEELKSLSGKARQVTIPREAMGMGDVYLMGMLGACLGWQSVLFTVFAACLFSIVLAILGRMGFGSRLPFGPSLAFGAVCWMFWGWQTWDWYFGLLALPPA
ncbi:prepilin peptidase [Verrucomicrobiaceae bacterium N1E253]|uniref:Prepilin peptidase n=1 Tax=Oceaniferula marina TaxID=2748318 RepID=A0A851GPZ7_9BACT|nr:A24 family peptidase [Oceaniferula marina]NWK56224.1 prepilin peptidase [Oceaniferula marina]